MIAEALAQLFAGILRAVEAERTEAARIARAKREVLALSLRLSSNTLLKKLLARGGVDRG